jgi:hypothetical protein
MFYVTINRRDDIVMNCAEYIVNNDENGSYRLLQYNRRKNIYDIIISIIPVLGMTKAQAKGYFMETYLIDRKQIF